MAAKNENELYAGILCSHLRNMIRGLRKLGANEWDYTPNVAAPTPRILATHAYQWLICDRQHINEPDALKHEPVPEPPSSTEAFCDAFGEEVDRWEKMILSFTPEELNSPRKQFNSSPMNVRDFIGHMVQNCIYKNGQFSTLYFALGHDGTEPYDAPFPNKIYPMVWEQQERKDHPSEGYKAFSRAFADDDIPDLILWTVYDEIWQHLSNKETVKPGDRLEEDYHLSRFEVSTEWLTRHLAGMCDKQLGTAKSEIVTVADLVRAIAAA